LKLTISRISDHDTAKKQEIFIEPPELRTATTEEEAEEEEEEVVMVVVGRTTIGRGVVKLLLVAKYDEGVV
jgi:hypothetical protein